jgi:cytochrome b subunit of formate dehydrogenase
MSMLENKTGFTCLVVPWWLYASKVAALILLISGLAMLWKSLLTYEVSWSLMGLALCQLIISAVVGCIAKQ